MITIHEQLLSISINLENALNGFDPYQNMEIALDVLNSLVGIT